MGKLMYVPFGLGSVPNGTRMMKDQVSDTNSIARSDEAERFMRAEQLRDMPWLSKWQAEEILQRQLDKWFGPDADPELAERFLDNWRSRQEPEPQQHFGSWLRDQIEQRGWSQSDLARRIESHPSLVSKWIRGLQRPQARQCARIALALNIDSDVVLDAAGHIILVYFESQASAYDTLAESPIRDEILQLLNEVPEPLLAPLVPMLRAFADPEVAESALAQMSKSLSRIKAIEESSQATKGGNS